MPFRSWMYIFALGLILSGSVQAQEQENSAEDGANSESQPAAPYAGGIPVRIIEDAVSAQAREARERESTQREKEDLIAQQRMAVATEAMNDATQSMKQASWLSACLVLLGTALLAYTLKLTRDATKSAQRAVEVTSEVGNRQLRPYVYCSGVIWAPKPGLDIYICCENAGQTPADKVVITHEIHFVGAAIDPAPTRLQQNSEVGEIPPRTGVKIRVTSVGGTEFQFVAATVRGEIKWFDPITRERRVSPFYFICKGRKEAFDRA